MKALVLSAVLVLSSSAALASGFVCQGDGYTVKLYNEVQPSRGTANPAILVVSSTQVGTITTLKGVEIEKLYTDRAVSYEGQSHSRADGQFVFVRLSVARQATTSDQTVRQGHLRINANGGSFTANLVCQQYLKGN